MTVHASHAFRKAQHDKATEENAATLRSGAFKSGLRTIAITQATKIAPDTDSAAHDLARGTIEGKHDNRRQARKFQQRRGVVYASVSP